MPDETWDAIIVGAGPAGGLSATLLAERGWRVLLVERSPWPREKPCGGCLNANAIQLLKNAGLTEVLHHAAPLTRFDLFAGKEHLQLNLPRGAAIPRKELDANLVTAAINRGATFRSNTTATLLPATDKPFREIQIENQILRTPILLACDGIAGTLLEHEPWARWKISPRSYFGIAGTIDSTMSNTPQHSIGMHLGNGGYVGTARYSGGALHIAAAISLTAAKKVGGPLPWMQQTLHTPLTGMKILGTPLLTRSRQVAAHRVLAVGDSCGYIEPFTGEGVAWALRGAKEVCELLLHQNTSTLEIEKQWIRRHHSHIASRQRWCRLLRHALRHPRALELAMKTVRIFPQTTGLLHLFAAHIGGAGKSFDRELA